MPVQLIEIPPDQIDVDETRFPDRDDSWVFEHLLYYCSLFEPLPAIGVAISGNHAIVMRGHKYLRIAQILHREQIRAVVQSISPGSEFLRRQAVKQLDWAEIDAAERLSPIADRWHVFYFGRSLAAGEKSRFNRDVAGFFERFKNSASSEPQMGLIGEVKHDDEAQRAVFLVRAPTADERWFADYLKAVKSFHRAVAPIVSFQGRKFQDRDVAA